MVLFTLLASYSYFGGGIGNLLARFEEQGVFQYVLPFLLIFALVFGILSKINLFGSQNNRSINAIIALVVGLMSLQFNFVSIFFSELFPRVGVALSIVLVLLVIGGLFLDKKNKGMMIGITVFVFIIIGYVIINTMSAVGWSYGYWWQDNWTTLLTIVIFLGLIIAIIVGSKPQSRNPEVNSPITWGLVPKSS